MYDTLLERWYKIEAIDILHGEKLVIICKTYCIFSNITKYEHIFTILTNNISFASV